MTTPISTITHQQQIPLTRLLTHLEATLSNSSNHTPAHRARIATNLEHARALYLTFEKSVVTNRVPGAKREEALEELGRQREWIRKLEGKLRELGELDDDDDEGESDEEGEDLLNVYRPAREGMMGGLDVGGETLGLQDEGKGSQGREQSQQQQQQQQQQELRERKGLSVKDNRSAATTSAREALFSNRPQDQQAQATSDISKTETMMSHHRNEQEALTTGLLGLAAALKQSSIQFSTSLEAERDVLQRAEGGLDKSAQGMDAAGKKMGTLRRMSEGQGWWGRIKLYAFIFGLWLGCFLLVFVGPKLRF